MIKLSPSLVPLLKIQLLYIQLAVGDMKQANITLQSLSALEQSKLPGIIHSLVENDLDRAKALATDLVSLEEKDIDCTVSPELYTVLLAAA